MEPQKSPNDQSNLKQDFIKKKKQNFLISNYIMKLQLPKQYGVVIQTDAQNNET